MNLSRKFHKTFFAFLLCICSLVSWGQMKNSVENYKKFMSLSYAELGKLLSSEYEQGNLENAIPYALAAKEKAKAEFGTQDTIYADYLIWEGFIYSAIGEYAKAEPLFLEAIEIQKKIFGEQHPVYANGLLNLADLYQNTGNFVQAEQLLLQTIAIQKKSLGELNTDYAASLNNLAALYQSIANYTQAEIFYLKAMAIWKKLLGAEHPDYATSLNNLSNLYQNIGDYAKAEALCVEAIAIYKKVLGEEHPEYAAALYSLANLYERMENYTKAEPLFFQVITIWKKTLGEEHPYYAKALTNLAALYTTMRDYEKAEPLCLQALAIYKKTVGEWHPDYAIILNNLASLYEIIKNYTKSESLYLQSIQICKKIYGEWHPAYANSLINLAELYKIVHNYAKAEPLLLQGMNIYKKNFGANHSTYAASLNSLAIFYRDIGKLDTAFHFCQLSIAANTLLMDSSAVDLEKLHTFNYLSKNQANASISTLLTILRQQYLQYKDKNKAETYYIVSQAAIKLNEHFRKDFTAEGEKLHILDKNNEFVIATIATGLQLKKENFAATAFEFTETNKGILLLESAQTANAHQFGALPDTIATQETMLQKKHSSLTAQLLEERPVSEKDSLRRVLNNVNQQINVFTKRLKEQYPQYTALKYDNNIADAKSIQASLDKKTALLEYLISDSVVYIFYIDKANIKLIPVLLFHKVLTEKIKTFYGTLSNYQLAANEAKVSYKKYTENAYWFYENLVQPALQYAKGIEHLIIIPDGELGHLPFETFLTKFATQGEVDYHQLDYLSNNYKISYNYSATLWKNAKETAKKTNNGQILGMASNYEPNASLALQAKAWRLPYEQELRATLSPLPAAQQEIEILSKNFQGLFAFDQASSEVNFKLKAADYAVIHLAMHGLLDAKNPILSSLAFTEDGDSLENNFLQAYEISKMKLNADLVVLSACETGYGRFEKGNGIASLAQAFAYAGVPAMIVSLWQVNDYATAAIMQNLYQNLANGMAKDEALQQAKLKYLQEAEGIAAHPAFWSPFILIGNTDAVYLKTKTAWLWWGILGGSLALLAVGFWWLRRKK